MVSDYQLPAVACLFLFFAMLSYWISLITPKNMFFFQGGKIFVLFSNLLFALTLLLRWIGENYFPLSNLYESLIFLSWGISTIHLFIEFQTKSRLIGCIVSPILFFIAGFSSLTLPTDMQKALPLVPSLQSNWLMMHVTMMMISYATLIVGSLLSLLYLAFLTFDSSNRKSSLPSTSNGSLPKEVHQGVYVPLKSDSEMHRDVRTNPIVEDDGLPKEVDSVASVSTFSHQSLPLPNQDGLPKEVPALREKVFIQINHLADFQNSNHALPREVAPLLEEKQNGLREEVVQEEQNTKKIFSSSKQALLQIVDLWSYRIIGLGFPFLTIGIISGAVWANEAWGSYWSWDPKETWALITWLVFAIYLHARLIKGWQGKQAAILGSCGFFVIWICYLGVNFLGKGLHSYGWVF